MGEGVVVEGVAVEFGGEGGERAEVWVWGVWGGWSGAAGDERLSVVEVIFGRAEGWYTKSLWSSEAVMNLAKAFRTSSRSSGGTEWNPMRVGREKGRLSLLRWF